MNWHTSWQGTVAIVGVALLVAVVGSRSHDVLAHPEGFVFTPLVFLGTPTPVVDMVLFLLHTFRYDAPESINQWNTLKHRLPIEPVCVGKA